jgi:hypothetical protein
MESMNIAESMAFVLKNKSQSIFSGFFKNDLKFIFKEIKTDFVTLGKSSKDTFVALPKKGFKIAWGDVKETSIETAHILRDIPKRVTVGFKNFRDDFLEELEGFGDPKEKTIFTMKVIGALSSFTLGTVAGVRGSKKGFGRHSMTAFLKSEIILRLSQILVLRILNEVEKSLTDAEDLKNLSYFRTILTDVRGTGDVDIKDIHEDEAVKIVEKLKNYIMTGQDKIS